MVFFAETPKLSFPMLLRLIKDFGKLAGLYVNKNKSKILLKNINKNEQDEIQKITSCEVAKRVKYLGVKLTNRNIDLVKNNYEELWKDLRKDLIRWNNLKLLLLGRISMVKMNVLPRILYLFQTLPILQKKNYFAYWKKEITDFIWAGKKPRIKFKVMCDKKDRGGLSLPKFELYHDVCALAWITEWVLTQYKKLLTMEGFNARYGWHAYLLYDKHKVDSMFNHHYIRKSLLSVWNKYRKYHQKGRRGLI